MKKKIKDPAAWINSLTEKEKDTYLDESNVYLKIVDGNAEAFGSLSALVLSGFGEKDFDMVIPASEWKGKAYVKDGKIFITEKIVIAREEKKNQIANTRWELCNSELSITTPDMKKVTIKIDLESRMGLLASQDSLSKNTGMTKMWKTLDGWIELTLSDIAFINDAITRYHQACFDHEALKVKEIDSLATVEEVEKVKW